MAEGPLLLSVIVTSYTPDRLQDVYELLGSIQGQSYPYIETVFVGERDPNLCRQVRAYARAIAMPRVKVAFNHGVQGLSAARNLGLRHARGEVIAFVDDDVILFPDWAEEMVNTYAQHEAAIGATGAAYPAWERPAMAWFPKEFYWIISCTDWLEGQGVREVRNAWGMNMSFRKEAFAYCSFDEGAGGNRGAADGSKLGLLGEDTQLSWRLRRLTGRPIIFNPAVRVWHKVRPYRLQRRFIRRRAFWEGYTKAYLNKHRNGAWKKMPLKPEYALLRRIALGFFPRLLAKSLHDPATAWRQFCLATDALGHVALGYAAARVPSLGGIRGRIDSLIERRLQ